MSHLAPCSSYSRDAVLLIAVVSHGALAQGDVRIPDDLSCPRCNIVLEHITTLGREGEGIFPSRPYFAERDSRGYYYVITPESSPSAPLVFDARGNYMHPLGREGPGPNEYRNPSAIAVDPSDTIYVFDAGNARVAVLSPSGKEVRTAPIPPVMTSAIRLGSGDLVVNARVRGADRFGHPFHVFDRAGNYLRSFGGGATGIRVGEVVRFVRWMAPAQDDEFWAIPFGSEYVIELWKADGTRLQRYVRDADWFPPYERHWLPTPDRAPAPSLVRVWADSTLPRHVWVVARVGDSEWRRGLGPAQRMENRTIYPLEDPQRIYDTMIELLDLSRGRVVARRRLDETIDLVLGGGLVGGQRQTRHGVPYLELWQVRLQRS